MIRTGKRIKKYGCGFDAHNLFFMFAIYALIWFYLYGYVIILGANRAFNRVSDNLLGYAVKIDF